MNEPGVNCRAVLGSYDPINVKEIFTVESSIMIFLFYFLKITANLHTPQCGETRRPSALVQQD